MRSQLPSKPDARCCTEAQSNFELKVTIRAECASEVALKVSSHSPLDAGKAQGFFGETKVRDILVLLRVHGKVWTGSGRSDARVEKASRNSRRAM
jgi:hypothetical protein